VKIDKLACGIWKTKLLQKTVVLIISIINLEQSRHYSSDLTAAMV